MRARHRPGVPLRAQTASARSVRRRPEAPEAGGYGHRYEQAASHLIDAPSSTCGWRPVCGTRFDPPVAGSRPPAAAGEAGPIPHNPPSEVTRRVAALDLPQSLEKLRFRVNLERHQDR